MVLFLSEHKCTCARYAPIIRNAGALRRRFEATERKERVSGISRACSIGFSTCSFV